MSLGRIGRGKIGRLFQETLKARREREAVILIPHSQDPISAHNMALRLTPPFPSFTGRNLVIGKSQPLVKLKISCSYHSNEVLNAAMLCWPVPNVLYVVGYALDRFAEGLWALQLVHQNRVGLVLDAAIEGELRLCHLQVADATRASLGLPVWNILSLTLLYWYASLSASRLKTNGAKYQHTANCPYLNELLLNGCSHFLCSWPNVEKWVDPKSGQSTGRVKHPDSLPRAVQTLVNRTKVNAVAVVGCFLMKMLKTWMIIDKGWYGNYILGYQTRIEASVIYSNAFFICISFLLILFNPQGIDDLAGVEAVISHLVVKEFQIPCAHAPALSPFPLSLSLCPKSAAEEVSNIF
ncbi:putative lipoprotein [Vitis vinifera]|uniref:Putative lipoprotein n=1 Tax=Vitis vinifera TaxID=29760 RepID=A0A438C123_VITVI|nr:putative lipoprotein [Vitis vinifera]